jgi:hypothetical protein
MRIKHRTRTTGEVKPLSDFFTAVEESISASDVFDKEAIEKDLLNYKQSLDKASYLICNKHRTSGLEVCYYKGRLRVGCNKCHIGIMVVEVK